jgi:hypothetical protein
MGLAMPDDPHRDAREAIIRAIAELKAAGIPVPIALYLAVHALTYALGDGRVLPFKRGEPPQ